VLVEERLELATGWLPLMHERVMKGEPPFLRSRRSAYAAAGEVGRLRSRRWDSNLHGQLGGGVHFG
jgi:hypothetical protein